ncbi:MAG: methyltransferase domain-containing protein [Candidatus Riflebacteria bacterium]|nr:methyltransferase domain-containing protein [Candidatus Riflebacteria bacterium]
MIFCYDIDGTICTNTNGEYEKAVPFPEIINQLNSRFDQGHKIILFTARGSLTHIDWRATTEQQLLSWKVKYHELHFGKPNADIYIDDKSFNPLGNVFGDFQSVLNKETYLKVTYPQGKAKQGGYPDLLAKKLYKDYFRKEGRLLDVGCGLGEYLDSFHRLGLQVCGIDISPQAPEYAKPHCVKVVDFENNEIPFPSESFDYVFSKSVIEHLKNPIALFSKIFSLLRPGGIAVFMTPSWEYNYWGPFYIDHTHVTPFTRNSLKETLQLANFQNIRSEYFRQLPFLWKYPYLKFFAKVLEILPLPYRPLQEAYWPEPINKLIRFSKEVMLLAVATK